MLRSMFSAVSGLRAHQTFMDVIGNNIANVNTAGFKSSEVVFADLLSQTVASAGAPTSTQGGTNPAQVGLGARVGTILTNFSQGSAQLTGVSTDVSIQGDGFFVVSNAGQKLFTRAGDFSFDGNGNLTTPNGSVVQGWIADTSGNIDTTTATSNLQFSPGQVIAPNQTSYVNMTGNLPSDAAAGAVVTATITTYDSRGAAVDLTLTFTKATTADEWTASASSPGGAANHTFDLVFDPSTGYEDTSASSLDGAGVTHTYDFTPADGTWSAPIRLNFGASGQVASLSEFAGVTTAAASSQDGAPIGSLLSFNIGQDGSISGVYSNGKSAILAKIAIANFDNASGLEKVGNTMYRQTVDSGVPQVGVPNTGGRGTLASGTLEMSNVDLAQEFTNLIVAQRGFQANSKVITVSDQILGDLINMKQ